MFSGPPLPLPAELPLSFLLGRIRPAEILGAWVRIPAHRLVICCRQAGRILVSADLGCLLRHCNRVALRQGSTPVILAANTVIRWRTLQVVTALPHLPGLERLAELFPGVIHCSAAELLIPICAWSPEEVLAECLATGIPVAGSRVVYHAPSS